jgi:hypothetical protein
VVEFLLELVIEVLLPAALDVLMDAGWSKSRRTVPEVTDNWFFVVTGLFVAGALLGRREPPFLAKASGVTGPDSGPELGPGSHCCRRCDASLGQVSNVARPCRDYRGHVRRWCGGRAWYRGGTLPWHALGWSGGQKNRLKTVRDNKELKLTKPSIMELRSLTPVFDGLAESSLDMV